MSAWIVSKAHIDALVSEAARRGPDGPFMWEHGGRRHTLPFADAVRATEVGQMLWKENHRSINYRYDERGRTPHYDWNETPHLPSMWVYKANACYSYQTCERTDWEQSEAFAFVQALYAALLPEVGPDPRNTKEWNDAPWGLDERHFVTAIG
jgi:hypothetical protein